MKTIQIRALYFKAVKPAMRELTVTDEFYDQIPHGVPEATFAQLLGLTCPEYVRRYQIQHDGYIIYSTPNRSASTYPCDSEPW